MSMGNSLKQDKPRPSRKELAIRVGVLLRKAGRLGIPSVVVIEGLDGSGKGLLLNRLILEIDARAYDIYSTHASDEPARDYPLLWRMWNHTPVRGKLQFFDRSAYYLALDTWADGEIDDKDFDRYMDDIRKFERQLADNGTLLVKVLLTVSKKEQARRFRNYENNPKTAWRVTGKDWKRHRQYQEYLEQARKMMTVTDEDYAPWKEIATDDLKEATISLHETVITAFEAAIEKRKKEARNPEPERPRVNYEGTDYLAEVDLSAKLERKQYKMLLKERQAEIHELAHQIHEHRVPVVMVYCGWDAAGKGGCIKRLLQGVDPRSFTVVPIAAPTKLELNHHYLWRFWKELPPRGKITIFDRSWYGRVLVERVEDLCSIDEWQQAYGEINAMERHLTDFGAVVIKFWLHIDQDTQLERFRAREEDPFKQWKITDEDWRNRKKYSQYEQAVNEMVHRTNTPYAPWNLVASNCKMSARIETLDTFIEAINSVL